MGKYEREHYWWNIARWNLALGFMCWIPQHPPILVSVVIRMNKCRNNGRQLTSNLCKQGKRLSKNTGKRRNKRLKGGEIWFCGRIHVSTQLHGHISKVVSCLNSNSHEISYPVVEWSSMCFSSCFNYYPTSGVAMKTSFSNDVSVGKGDFWNLIYYFYLLANTLE